MLNVIWNIEQGKFRIDLLMASLVFFTWLKLIFFFRVSTTFGPVFKIIEEMTIDLGKFMVIWSLIFIMFTFVAILAFG